MLLNESWNTQETNSLEYLGIKASWTSFKTCRKKSGENFFSLLFLYLRRQLPPSLPVSHSSLRWRLVAPSDLITWPHFVLINLKRMFTSFRLFLHLFLFWSIKDKQKSAQNCFIAQLIITNEHSSDHHPSQETEHG